MIKVFTSLWRLKVMAGKYKFNSLFSLSVLSVCALMLSSCSDENSTPDTSALDAPRLTIVGSDGASPAQTNTYTVVGEGLEGVSWSIAQGGDVASVASTDGASADIAFSSVGTVLLQASSGGVDGFFEVTVSVGDLTWEVSFDETLGYANEGGTSVATLTFNYPLTSIEGASLSKDIGSVALAGSGTEWTATFTGGSAARDSADVLLANVVVSSAYGGASVEEAVATTFQLDNQPSAWLSDVSISASAYNNDGSTVADSAEVTITWTFSEGVRGAIVPDDVYPADPDAGDFGDDADEDADDKNGVADMEMHIDDTNENANIGDSSYVALSATDDPAVWTYTWTANGDSLRAETTHWDGDDFWDGDGNVSFDLALEGVVDLAGNPLDLDLNGSKGVGGSTSISTLEDDGDDALSISPTAMDVEPGSGVVMISTGGDDDTMWLFVENGTTPPASYDALTESGDATFIANPGIYDIYFGKLMDNGNAPVDSDGNVIFFKINNFVVAEPQEDE